MTFNRRTALLAACSGLLAAHPLATLAQGQAPKTIGWDDLLPKNWNPWADFQTGGLDLRNLSDDDPRAAEALRRLRRIWDDAPLNAAMDGALIRLPGYVVPLEETAQGLRELLLVPHYGACIHTPPPPANQILHVLLDKPMKSLSTMDTVWVSGPLKARRATSVHGVSGYQLAATKVERYAPGR
ncbi:DUF3299 domain-containing protein [Xenophilus arseniciresistens]|uniref:DUF3299 domain-containing protein n=1 Tax=Xenophilus arseniciresistens TaxID=1283306 RepID=A0AAE3N7E3_9BURK|nr:DUF3299 domain-containing protein [Xenophilus arseniciresistens]MDA7415272.1 DUF3299 domain-containing protein [Xenophilus arseniciresistens]